MLTSLAKDALLLRQDLQGENFRGDPTSGQVSNDKVEVRNVALSANTTDLSLFVQSPNGVESLGVLVPNGTSDHVWETGVSRSKDDDVELLLRAVFEGDFGVGVEGVNLPLLDLDITIGDHFGSTSGEVIASGFFQSH